MFANPGNGISAHRTSLPGANVTLSFYGTLDDLMNHPFATLNWLPHKGTGVELHGTANCTFDVTVDDVFSSPLTTTSDVLYSTQTLSDGFHTLTLTAHPTSEQQLAFENAVIYMKYVNYQRGLFSDLRFVSVKQSHKRYLTVIPIPRSSIIPETGLQPRMRMYREAFSILPKRWGQPCLLHLKGHRRWSYRVL